jgi:hypothetical protein
VLVNRCLYLRGVPALSPFGGGPDIGASVTQKKDRSGKATPKLLLDALCELTVLLPGDNQLPQALVDAG